MPASSLQVPCEEAPAVSEAPQKEGPKEYDLDIGEDVALYILAHFKSSAQGEARPAVEYFVGQMKKKTTKAKPLSSWIHQEIVGTKVLMKPQRRQMWLACWQKKQVSKVCLGAKVRKNRVVWCLAAVSLNSVAAGSDFNQRIFKLCL